MGTEITRKQAATLVPLKKSSDATKVAVLLTELSYARMATIDANILDYLSQQLSIYHFPDVQAAIKGLCHTKRKSGETAFPDLPTLEEAVSDAARSRRASEGTPSRVALELEERERHRKEHPEEYVSVRDIIAAFLQTKGMSV